MTTLKEHIAFLQTLSIPYKGTLIGYLKHVIYEHYSSYDDSEIMTDTTSEKMPFNEFVRACLQRNPAQCPECRSVKSAPDPDHAPNVVCLLCGLSYDPTKRPPAPLPIVQETHETAQTP